MLANASQFERGAVLFAVADSMRAVVADSPDPIYSSVYLESLKDIKENLRPDEFTKCWDLGRSMSRAEVQVYITRELKAGLPEQQLERTYNS